jgi:hypothetical protein
MYILFVEDTTWKVAFGYIFLNFSYSKSLMWLMWIWIKKLNYQKKNSNCKSRIGFILVHTIGVQITWIPF